MQLDVLPEREMQKLLDGADEVDNQFSL